MTKEERLALLKEAHARYLNREAALKRWIAHTQKYNGPEWTEAA